MRREGVLNGAIGVGVFEAEGDSSVISTGGSVSSFGYTDAESSDEAGLGGIFASTKPRASWCALKAAVKGLFGLGGALDACGTRAVKYDDR